jgi:quinol monooxygenase YgiN
MREQTVPAAQQQEGFKGYIVLVDRSTGKGLTITLWEEEEDRECTGPNSSYYREAIGKIVPLLEDAPSVEDLELVIHI